MSRPLHRRVPSAFRAAWRELAGKRAAYDGAAMNRLLLDWIAQSRLADEEIKCDMRTLRARSRELARNHSAIRRYFRLLQNNTIGHMGMRLLGQVMGPDGKRDTSVNKTIEATWKLWADAPVTVDGKLTLRRFERLLLKTVACDGEAFVRLWRNFSGNLFGFALQAIDADLIDEQFNRRPRPGENEIRMGVEIDSIGNPVGYHIFYSLSDRRRYFVPAAELIHLYDPDRVNQTRGVTWIHSIMVPAHMLNAYEESEAVAARIGASTMGWFQKKDSGDGEDLSSDKKPAAMQANPGRFEIVPSGYEVQTWQPEHPSGNFMPFVKQMMRKIASGVSVFYNVLANDAEGVTYSTMRSFTLIEQDDWRSVQQDFIDMWRRPLYAAWLEMGIMVGLIALPSPWGDGRFTRINPRYLAVRHDPRGWQWIDPEKEGKAAALQIDWGLNSRTRILAARGETLEDIFAELAYEKDLAEQYGIEVDGEIPPTIVTASDTEDGGDGTSSSNGNGKTKGLTSPNDALEQLLANR